MMMSKIAKRSTVYLEPELHRALRIKAIHSRRSMSDIVNDAVRETLREDAEDLAAFDERAEESTLSYEELLKDLRAHGKI
jgi:plasmid stability protein